MFYFICLEEDDLCCTQFGTDPKYYSKSPVVGCTQKSEGDLCDGRGVLGVLMMQAGGYVASLRDGVRLGGAA